MTCCELWHLRCRGVLDPHPALVDASPYGWILSSCGITFKILPSVSHGVISSIKFLFIVSSKEVQHVWWWMEKQSRQRTIRLWPTNWKQGLKWNFKDMCISQLVDCTQSYRILLNPFFESLSHDLEAIPGWFVMNIHQSAIKLNDLFLKTHFNYHNAINLGYSNLGYPSVNDNVSHKSFCIHSKEDATPKPHTLLQGLKCCHIFHCHWTVINRSCWCVRQAGRRQGDLRWGGLHRAAADQNVLYSPNDPHYMVISNWISFTVWITL